jgi:outer membrane protein W
MDDRSTAGTREIEMRIARVVLATSLACGVASPAILAGGPSWTLRFHGAIVESSGGDDVGFADGVVSRVDSGGGFGIAVEARLSNRIGLELSTLYAGIDVRMQASARLATAQSVALSVIPVTFGLPIHLPTGDRLDLFVAPTLNIVTYNDVRTTFDGFGMDSSVSVDSDLGFGAALGLDVPFGKGKWAFSSGLRYIKTRADETDIDPVIVTIGFAYRF